MPTIEVDIRKHILETLKTEEPLCIAEISSRLNLPREKTAPVVNRMEIAGILVRANKPHQKELYYYRAEPDKTVEEALAKSASIPIYKSELVQAAKKCKIGSNIRVFNNKIWNRNDDSWGKVEMATVIAKYPFLVRLNNGCCVSYAQLALYYRSPGRRRCIM